MGRKRLAACFSQRLSTSYRMLLRSVFVSVMIVCASLMAVGTTLAGCKKLPAQGIGHAASQQTATVAEPVLPAVETPNPWFSLDIYQRSLTRKEFERKLEYLYDPFDAMRSYVDINDARAVFWAGSKYKAVPVFTLEFAASPEDRAAPLRPFRTPAQIRAMAKPAGKPLYDLHIAIDPGHIGGKWAQVENRSTRYRGSAPVNEGDLNIITAHILQKQLTDLGATVFLVRETTDPVTPYRPADFIEEAREALLAHNPKLADRLKNKTTEQQIDALRPRIQDVADFLFYRGSEIPERGSKIRVNFKPDITITLYLNATPRSSYNALTPINRNIFFVHGSYTREEIADLDQRRQLVGKLLENGSAIEAEVADNISRSFKKQTGFPPVMYGDSRTTRLVVPGNMYVVARNLAANRNYPGPVVCVEPYFMNQVVTYRRLLAGDYDGTKTFDGTPYRSIFRDYANAVTEGLIRAYGPPEPPAPVGDVATGAPH
jgi:N-acetylmuramoyl-L-alanine amidase